jgi:5'-nucleotidase
MRIMVTNDDGIEAQGIVTLVQTLADWIAEEDGAPRHQLIVIAPDQNYSGASAAVGDIFSREGVDFYRAAIEGAEQVEAFALDASPALCSIVACRGAFGPRPDLIVSGINAGINVGNSVLHSGTIGAVLTGSQLGISGVAVSLQARRGADYRVASALALGLVEELEGAPPGTVLSLNVPALPMDELKGVRRGRVASAGLINEVHRGTPHAHSAMGIGDKGTLALKLGAAVPSLGDVSDEISDLDDGALVAQGYATITELRTVHDDPEPAAEAVIHGALAAIDRRLRLQVSES